MFYRMYLSSVCQRRQWSEPLYEPLRQRHGYHCKVVVNNREYCTDVAYETEDLARDGAAMKAYLICRNFSSNDGYYPGQRPGQKSANGVAQGVPVPIGTGRRGGMNRMSAGSSSYGGDSPPGSDGTSSGNNSPKSTESAFETQFRQQQQQQVAMMMVLPPQQMPKAAANHHHRRKYTADDGLCYCRRARVHAYGRCGYCLRESGWA